MSMERLDMLMKVAAQKLSDLPAHQDNGMTTYELEHGNAMAFKLLKKKGIAVADSFLSKGTIFPYHKHNGCKEFIMVYDGCVTLICDDVEDNRIELRAGDHAVVGICIGHALFAKEDSWMVAITIPADENFPG